MEIGKKMKLSWGLEFIAITPEEWEKVRPQFEADRFNWMPYDSQLIQMHIANCGFGILDAEYMTAIDDEGYLSEIYTMLEKQ